MTSRGDAHRRGTRAGAALVGFLTLASALAACDRTYLTPSHGRAYREIFAAQTVNPKRRAEAKNVQGLDSQEASIIAGTYRKQLASGQNEPNQGQVLTYSRNNGGGMREAPASTGPNQN